MPTWILAGLKALAALCGFGEKVTEEAHDKNQRDAGANAEAVKVMTDENQAIVADRVRDADPRFADRVRNDHGIDG